MTLTVSLPLEVVYYRPKTSRGKIRKFILNLNNYRNAPFIVLAKAKEAYKELIAPLFPEGVKLGRSFLIYEYHHGSRRRIDTLNPCSIINKFTEDTITELGLWEDDNSRTLTGHLFIPGEPDKERPRCDLTIVPQELMKPTLTSFLKTGITESMIT